MRKITKDNEDIEQRAREFGVLELSTLYEVAVWRKGKMGPGKSMFQGLGQEEEPDNPMDTSWRLRRPGE